MYQQMYICFTKNYYVRKPQDVGQVGKYVQQNLAKSDNFVKTDW